MYLDNNKVRIRYQNRYKKGGINYNSTRITINLPTGAQISRVRQVEESGLKDAFYYTVQNAMFIHSINLYFDFDLTKDL